MEILMGWGSYLKDHPGWGGGVWIFSGITQYWTPFLLHPFKTHARADVYICTSVFLSFKPGAECPDTT